MRCPSCPKRGVQASVPADHRHLAGNDPAGSGGTADTDVGAPETDSIVDVIEELVRERNSGFGFPDDLTELEKQLVMIWDETVRAYDRAHEIRIAQMFQMLVAMTAPR